MKLNYFLLYICNTEKLASTDVFQLALFDKLNIVYKDILWEIVAHID